MYSMFASGKCTNLKISLAKLPAGLGNTTSPYSCRNYLQFYSPPCQGCPKQIEFTATLLSTVGKSRMYSYTDVNATTCCYMLLGDHCDVLMS